MLEINKINIFDEKFDEKIKNLASKSNIENDSIISLEKLTLNFLIMKIKWKKTKKRKKLHLNVQRKL
jgi:hypothetical protein